MILNERIRALRMETGMSQEELGKLINKSKSNISQFELGKREPDNGTLLRLSEIFGCTLDYLLGKSDNKTIQDEKISNALGVDEELQEFWKVLKEREDLKLMLKQTKDLPESDIKTIFRIIKSFEDENQKNSNG